MRNKPWASRIDDWDVGMSLSLRMIMCCQTHLLIRLHFNIFQSTSRTLTWLTMNSVVYRVTVPLILIYLKDSHQERLGDLMWLLNFDLLWSLFTLHFFSLPTSWDKLTQSQQLNRKHENRDGAAVKESSVIRTDKNLQHVHTHTHIRL